ncbi:hypothetical protein, partial [Thiolapillus sp.]|uniref:hypothetical protein n=5 Tax=Thiolapillus sp. TaxID=2017437 RepID=UPI003AF5D10F
MERLLAERLVQQSDTGYAILNIGALLLAKSLHTFEGVGKRVFDLMIDFGTSQSPKSTRPLTTYWCPSRPGHPALRNNFASSLLLRTWLPYDWTPRSEAYFVFPLAQGTPGKQCGLAATGVYQPSLRSPWLAAPESGQSRSLFWRVQDGYLVRPDRGKRLCRWFSWIGPVCDG